MKSSYKDKVVIITGASSGIGRALAIELAGQGAKIVLAARNKEALTAVAAECQSIGGEAFVVPTDISEKAQCEHLIENTIEEFGYIDILVNNAGISMWAYFGEFDDLDWFEKMMKVNYMGAVYCTKFALPYLKNSAGLIVAVSSLAGKTGVPTRSGYAASKHALVGFFDSLRIEIADSGVDVTLVYPGFVATEIRKRALGWEGKPLEQSPIQEGKAMSPEECARSMAKGMAKRKREIVMTLRGKLGQWIKLIAPGLVDKIARKAIKKGK
ncbi:MAG: SDR family oxidoreductase [Candidatus Marinimicrobia bacterium]|nr:SDR family oxidoreductase [Candidatus Neomarinimicrobiota bacterium]MCF7828019.1 SDR family oxidoreductase [Candidatus Neomarinimicrobiota bacterium]MCF7879226.1 SDR family oxidoreductase [Candidatus Neomarinimicrobiota bacterium]